MANRYFKQFVLTQDARQVLICGSTSLSSAAAVSSSDVNGLVESITKTATGTYQILLKDPYVKVRSINLQYSGDEDIQVQSITEDVASAKTIVFKTCTAGVATDVTVACKIYINIVLKDSTVQN